jgi:hypothetical protein
MYHTHGLGGSRSSTGFYVAFWAVVDLNLEYCGTMWRGVMLIDYAGRDGRLVAWVFEITDIGWPCT